MRARNEYKYNPLDFQKDVAIGILLPLTNNDSAIRTYGYETEAAGVLLTGDVVDTKHVSTKVSTQRNQGDFQLSYTTVEQTKSNLMNLVLTNRGERPMHPNFGCDVWKTLFEPNTADMRLMIEDLIRKQISVWLPFVKLKDVRVLKPTSNEHRMDIKIEWTLYEGNAMDLQHIALTVGGGPITYVKE